MRIVQFKLVSQYSQYIAYLQLQAIATIISPTFTFAKTFTDLFVLGQLMSKPCITESCPTSATAFEWRVGYGAGATRGLTALVIQSVVFMGVLLLVDYGAWGRLYKLVKTALNGALHRGGVDASDCATRVTSRLFLY